MGRIVHLVYMALGTLLVVIEWAIPAEQYIGFFGGFFFGLGAIRLLRQWRHV